MTLSEYWALMEAARDRSLKAAGKLTPREEAELRDWVKNGDS